MPGFIYMIIPKRSEVAKVGYCTDFSSLSIRYSSSYGEFTTYSYVVPLGEDCYDLEIKFHHILYTKKLHWRNELFELEKDGTYLIDEFQKACIKTGLINLKISMTKPPRRKLFSYTHFSHPTKRIECILKLEDVIYPNFCYDNSKYEQLIEKEQNEEATEEDKVTLQRYRYLRYWNVQWSDEEFVNDHPLNKDDTARSLLKCLVSKKTQFLGFNYDKTNETLVGAGMIRELFEILGFKHIFDVTHLIDTSKLCFTKLEALKNSEFIKSYFRSCSVFKIDKKKKDMPQWTANSIMQAITIALRRTNLKMTNKRRQITVDGKREYYYIYQLDKESVQKASEMVLLSLKHSSRRYEWKDDLYPDIVDFMTKLDETGYQHYSKYLSLPVDLALKMKGLALDEASSEESSEESQSSVSEDSSEGSENSSSEESSDESESSSESSSEE